MRAHRLSRHANTSVSTIRNLPKKARRMTSVDLFHRIRLAPHRKRTKKLEKPRGPPKASAPYHCWGLHVLLRNASSPRGRNPPNPVRRHILLLYTRVVIIFFFLLRNAWVYLISHVPTQNNNGKGQQQTWKELHDNSKSVVDHFKTFEPHVRTTWWRSQMYNDR